MTIKEVLQTRPQSICRVVRRQGGEKMPYGQIQFTSDCIRRYARNVGKPLDEAFVVVQKAGGLDYINEMYAANPNLKAGFSARKLQRQLSVK